MRDHIRLFINGQPHVVRGDDAWMTLTDYLRRRLRLTGTKVVCAEGDCGSCTIALGRVREGKIDYTTVCGCIQRMLQLDATHVITIEGLSYDGGLNPVQSATVACNGAQCGYCTPGFVVTLHQLLQDGAKDPEHVRRKLTGNLCRCTGYDAILDAATQTDLTMIRPANELYPDDRIAPSLIALGSDEVLIRTDSRTFYKPGLLASAIQFRSEHPTSVLIAGGTDLGVVMNKRKADPVILISTAALPDFDRITVTTEAIEIGGGATHATIQSALADTIPQLAEYLEWFGSPQIRQAGTLAGNLATGSPIGDTLPPLLVLDASVELTGLGGARLVNLNDFYTGYRTSVMRSDELIARIIVPRPASGDVVRFYKVSKRFDLDISTFSAAIYMRMTGDVIATIRVALGGVGPMVIRLRKTEAFLLGKTFDEPTIDQARAIVLSEISPISDVRGSADYRNLLAGNFLRKVHAELTAEARS